MHLSMAHYRKMKLSICFDYHFIKLPIDSESRGKIKKLYLALMWRLKLLTCGKCVGCVVATLMYCSWPDPGEAFRCTSCGWCCDGEWFCAWAINWFGCDWCACMIGIFISCWRWICDGNSGGNIFSTSMNWIIRIYLKKIFFWMKLENHPNFNFTINRWWFRLSL